MPLAVLIASVRINPQHEKAVVMSVYRACAFGILLIAGLAVAAADGE